MKKINIIGIFIILLFQANNSFCQEKIQSINTDSIILLANNLFSEQKSNLDFESIKTSQINNENHNKTEIDSLILITNIFFTENYFNNKNSNIDNINDPNFLITKVFDSDSLIRYAKKYLGTRYRYAKMSPEIGFDCSGFVSYVYSHFNIKVPRSSRDYAVVGTKVENKKYLPGDVIIFKRGRKRIGHVGIIISQDENSLYFIHAQTREGISITDLTKSKYYQQRFFGVVRVVN